MKRWDLVALGVVAVLVLGGLAYTGHADAIGAVVAGLAVVVGVLWRSPLPPSPPGA